MRKRKKWKVMLAVLALLLVCTQPVRAAPDIPGLPTSGAEPLTPGENAAVSTAESYNDVFGEAIRVLGYIVAALGGAALGRSFPAQDPSQRLNGVLFLVSGLALVFLPSMVRWVMGV
ncbi:MAG: hypothetical protein Q4C48_10815 [Lachnospiraceae bacterium]|nr:hypothetical protein [Lachnospiraceae bacterium]